MDTMRAANKEFYAEETAKDVLSRFFASKDESLDLACAQYLLRFAKGPCGSWRFANEAPEQAHQVYSGVEDRAMADMAIMTDAVRRLARACVTAGRAAYTAQARR